jgi:heme a synthase
VVHRMFAFIVFTVVGIAAWKMFHTSPPGNATRKAAWALAALLLWQLITGLSNVVLGWPLLAAVSHTGGAAAMVIVMTGALCAGRARYSNAVHQERSGVATSTMVGMGYSDSVISSLGKGAR